MTHAYRTPSHRQVATGIATRNGAAALAAMLGLAQRETRSSSSL